MRLAMQFSSIRYVLFEIKVVKYKLCESSSRFVGRKILPRTVCSSTHLALVVIHNYVDIVDADDDPNTF